MKCNINKVLFNNTLKKVLLKFMEKHGEKTSPLLIISQDEDGGVLSSHCLMGNLGDIDFEQASNEFKIRYMKWNKQTFQFVGLDGSLAEILFYVVLVKMQHIPKDEVFEEMKKVYQVDKNGSFVHSEEQEMFERECELFLKSF